jgi:murein DD-endopeptidase MepM/ murein hydrolase activator NlpD
MFGTIASSQDDFVSRLRRFFRPRELFFHDGATMRRIHASTRAQMIGASVAAAALGLSIAGSAQIAGAAPMVAAVVSSDVAVVKMQARVSAMQSEVAALRVEAKAHAARLEARQAFLDSVLTGKGTPALPASGAQLSSKAADLFSPLSAVEARQVALASRAAALVETRYRETSAKLAQIGIRSDRIIEDKSAMGGPYEPVDATAVKGAPDATFRALFQSWKKLDQLQQGVVAIPSQKPVDVIDFTSGFGVRSDPFRGGAAMHAGVDIRGPFGTPIYATADGVVGRAGWANGYGNLVELNHGRGIETRYGHLSAILVQPGQFVKRGQQIARMGSTGRSTGNHLHYEVRLDGTAVNPMPFLQGANYLASMQVRNDVRAAMGGPASAK